MSTATRRVGKDARAAKPLAIRYFHPLKLERLASSLVAVALGGALALGEPGATRWPLLATVAVATLLLHAGGRFLLAAASARRALSRPWRGSQKYTALSLNRLLTLGAFCLLLGCAFWFLAVIERGWWMLWPGVVALLASLSYAQGPALREKGLAEVVSFILFGPLPVFAAYLAVTGAQSQLAVLASLPLGFLAAAASLAAGIRDVAGDRKEGTFTLASALGRPRVDYLFLGLISAAYGWLIFLVVRGLLAEICLLPLLTVPLAIRAYALLRAHPREGAEETVPLVGVAARLYLYFAIVLASCVAVSHAVWQRAI